LTCCDEKEQGNGGEGEEDNGRYCDSRQNEGYILEQTLIRAKEYIEKVERWGANEQSCQKENGELYGRTERLPEAVG
jgi:hypothetical protein